MSDAPISDQDRADLVAYLDGELGGEAARTIETRLNLDPTFRAEADSLKRAWELLDYLPRGEPSPSFTERTVARVVVPAGRAFPWWKAAAVVWWAAGVLLAFGAGYGGYRLLVPREPGEAELIRDLRLIENKRYYDLLDDLGFLHDLDHPDLFGDEPGE